LSLELRMPAVVLLFAAFVAATSSGLLVFKYGWPGFQDALASGRWFSRSALLVLLGAGLYATSFLLWLIIVSRLALTVAYPVAIGLSLVAITAGATVWLGEPLTMTRVAGAVLILAGVALIVH
jgi:multidrug transporter EmrE-like cation transporter